MQYAFQHSFKKLSLGFMAVLLTFSMQVMAEKKETYNEDKFLNTFSGKDKKVFVQKLGKPAKTQMSVKPSGASTFLARAGKEDDKSKPVKVEMWYYNNLVNYDQKHKYKETEITFVNDKALNIAFFNNR